MRPLSWAVPIGIITISYACFTIRLGSSQASAQNMESERLRSEHGMLNRRMRDLRSLSEVYPLVQRGIANNSCTIISEMPALGSEVRLSPMMTNTVANIIGKRNLSRLDLNRIQIRVFTRDKIMQSRDSVNFKEIDESLKCLFDWKLVRGDIILVIPTRE